MRPRGLLADQIQEKMQIDRKALQDITAKLQQPTLNEKQAQSVSAIESQNLLLKQIEIEDRLLQLSFKLKGFGSETILQQPSLPEKPSSPKKSQVTIIAGILAGFILLVFTFFRAALRAASDDPESASKLARIRKSFSF
jgi:LPS O-antigen subunit length determinant protein (WzzB/FepE family)